MTTASAVEVRVVRAQPLIQRLKISGMLSFGPEGIDLPMERLNVLIGPNGSGKSNFIEALALLQAAPHDLSAPVRRMGGISEWLWKGDGERQVATAEAIISYPAGAKPLHHTLLLWQQGERFEVAHERVRDHPDHLDEEPSNDYYVSTTDKVEINGLVEDSSGERGMRTLDRGAVQRDASILSQREDPDIYPELGWLQQQYRKIRLYRNWEFGPDAGLRRSPRADEPSTFLTERGENLPLVLSRMRGDRRQAFVKSLQQLYDGVDNFHVEVGGGRAELFLVERGGGERYIPASRLSDGTLRYMALAAILLDPDPPPLVVIEEPELGLHPDLTLGIGRMLVEASQRMQLVVTTHSTGLIDALDECPSSVVVCEKDDGASVFERLEPEYLTEWLEKYSLGKLWSAGDLGGNRW
jgi:predicted ATPase